jgi:preprotein translocase subunit SecG
MGYPPQSPPPGYGPPEGAYGPYQPQPRSNLPVVLSIIGIVFWFCCSPLSIALGLYAQSEFRKRGQPDVLAKVTWIGGIVALLLGILLTIVRVSVTGRTY